MSDAASAPIPDPVSGEERRAGPWAHVLAVLAIAAFAAGFFVPLPGVDAEAMDRIARSGLAPGLLGLFNVVAPLQSVFMLGPLALAAVHLAFALFSRSSRPNGRLAFAVYLAVCALHGLSVLFFIEGSRDAFGNLIEVSKPLGLLSVLGAAVTLWCMAELVARAGWGRGPLVLLGLAALWRIADSAVQWGQAYAPMDELGSAVLRVGGDVAPFAIVLGALAAWRQPERLGRLPLTALDLLCAPALGFALARDPASLLGWGLRVLSPSSSGGAIASIAAWAEAYLPLVVSLATALAVALWLAWSRRPGLRVRFGIGLAFVAALGFGTAYAAFRGASFPGASFRGDAGATVTLMRADERADGRADGPRLLGRLQKLGVRAELRRAEEGTVVLRVDRVRDVGELMRNVLAPGRLGFHATIDGAALAEAARRIGGAIEVREERGRRGSWHTVRAKTCEGLSPLLSSFRPPAGQLVAPECRPPDPDYPCCTAWLIIAQPAVGDEDIRRAQVMIYETRNRPYVSVDFTPSGAARFADLTAASVGKPLAIVLDGRVDSAPIVMDRIEGGRAQISLGGLKSYEELLREGRALAVALSVGALSGRWMVSKVESR